MVLHINGRLAVTKYVNHIFCMIILIGRNKVFKFLQFCKKRVNEGCARLFITVGN